MTRTRVARVAALLALTLAATLAVAQPAQAADPNPPYVSSSQPGGYELYGFHHKQISPTVHAWIGLQRGPAGAYRWWGKVQGNGKQLSATFTNVFLDASPNTWGPAYCGTSRDSTVYCYGGWHQITDLAVVQFKVTASYTGGASTGAPKNMESYIIRKGQRAAYAAPRPGW